MELCPRICFGPIHCRWPLETTGQYTIKNSPCSRDLPPLSMVAFDIAFMQQSKSHVMGNGLKIMLTYDFLAGDQSFSNDASFFVWMTTSL